MKIKLKLKDIYYISLICIILIIQIFAIRKIVDVRKHPKVIVKTYIIKQHPTFLDKNPKEGLMDALKFYDIAYPEIVYSQAVLETGNFTSGGCVNDNNLFGLYNSKDSCFFKFKHWYESVMKYKNSVQYKWDGKRNYYDFLVKLPYATDSNYINKIKVIQKREFGLNSVNDID